MWLKTTLPASTRPALPHTHIPTMPWGPSMSHTIIGVQITHPSDVLPSSLPPTCPQPLHIPTNLRTYLWRLRVVEASLRHISRRPWGSLTSPASSQEPRCPIPRLGTPSQTALRLPAREYLRTRHASLQHLRERGCLVGSLPHRRLERNRSRLVPLCRLTPRGRPYTFQVLAKGGCCSVKRAARKHWASLG